jgi:hypothetical protein
MFDTGSRYENVETATLTAPDGRVVTYVKRRFLPSAADQSALTEVTLAEGDRLDLIAARVLGDPLQYWRLCDASDVMNPADLAGQVGRRLRVPVPQG